MPAPPHDASGHTWHHPDDVLIRVVKEGTAAIFGGDYESDMPGFADALSDPEIRAVPDYTESTWLERERRYHERVSERNQTIQTELMWGMVVGSVAVGCFMEMFQKQ